MNTIEKFEEIDLMEVVEKAEEGYSGILPPTSSSCAGGCKF